MNYMKKRTKGDIGRSFHLKKSMHTALLFFFLALALPGWASLEKAEVQQSRRDITGVVTDTQGEPLPGVTVQVVGRQGGVITDADGNYSIQAATGEEVRFQYVGMRALTSKVGTGSVMNVVMQEDVELLDEVDRKSVV